MKKLILVLFAFFAVSTAIEAQSMKMIVDLKGNAVARFVRASGNYYIGEVQDTQEIPQAGHKVVTYSAANGQGIVYRNQSRTGNINVRKAPSTTAPVVAKIPEFDGIPDTYPCLGMQNGWYKIKIYGKIGFVRKDMAEWDGMDTF